MPESPQLKTGEKRREGLGSGRRIVRRCQVVLGRQLHCVDMLRSAMKSYVLAHQKA